MIKLLFIFCIDIFFIQKVKFSIFIFYEKFLKIKKTLFEEWFSTLPGTGLEPAHRKALGSKPSVSTNSTIPAPYL